MKMNKDDFDALKNSGDNSTTIEAIKARIFGIGVMIIILSILALLYSAYELAYLIRYGFYGSTLNLIILSAGVLLSIFFIIFGSWLVKIKRF
ncbi:MAG: hypothetical protein ACTSYS_08050 [Promethearchaeota archaeon]